MAMTFSASSSPLQAMLLDATPNSSGNKEIGTGRAEVNNACLSSVARLHVFCRIGWSSCPVLSFKLVVRERRDERPERDSQLIPYFSEFSPPLLACLSLISPKLTVLQVDACHPPISSSVVRFIESTAYMIICLLAGEYERGAAESWTLSAFWPLGSEP